MIPNLRSIAKPSILGVAAAAACMVLGAAGGCASGARERTMTARNSIVSADAGSTDIVYFSVHEDLPRTSIATPITATASQWLLNR